MTEVVAGATGTGGDGNDATLTAGQNENTENGNFGNATKKSESPAEVSISTSSSSTSAAAAESSIFRPSKLSGFTDGLWTQRKTEAASTKTSQTPQLDLSNSLKKSSAAADSNSSSSAAGGGAASKSNPFLGAAAAPKGFVFGSRISDRVTNVVAAAAEIKVDSSHIGGPTKSVTAAAVAVVLPSTTTKDAADSAAAPQPTGFRALAASAQDNQTTGFVRKSSDVGGQASSSKTADAAPKFGEYKPAEPTAAEQTTGEENETNIAQLHCKLHVFDAKGGGSWHERAQGVLRLNQTADQTRTANDVPETRLVMRTNATHCLVLNTKLFADMLLERVDPKRVRFSGTDGDSPTVQIFLITGAESDVEYLWSAVSVRLEALKREASSNGSGSRKRGAASDDSREEQTTASKKPANESDAS